MNRRDVAGYVSTIRNPTGPRETLQATSLRPVHVTTHTCAAPPSTNNSTPAMKLASCEPRNTAAFAISSGWPMRPSGTIGRELALDSLALLFRFSQSIENWSVDRAWTDRVDANLAVFQVLSPASGE